MSYSLLNGIVIIENSLRHSFIWLDGALVVLGNYFCGVVDEKLVGGGMV
jgi:hypothetical protein